MTPSPSPDARVVAVTTNSPGCLIISVATLVAVVGGHVWQLLNAGTLTGRIVIALVGLPFAAALGWMLIRIPAIRRGSAIAVDRSGLWWSEGDSAYADVIPWEEVRAVAVGVWRGPRRTNGLAMSRYLEVYLTDPALAGRHPKLASRWFDVRPPVDLPERCFRFHLSAAGAAEGLQRAVRETRPALWAGEFEHTVAPASAT